MLAKYIKLRINYTYLININLEIRNKTMNHDNVRIVKNIIREPFAFPGGYEKVAICNDGEILCHECCKDNYGSICHSTLHEINDGFNVVGMTTEAVMYNDDIDEDLISYCAHCSKAFGEMM